MADPRTTSLRDQRAARRGKRESTPEEEWDPARKRAARKTEKLAMQNAAKRERREELKARQEKKKKKAVAGSKNGSTKPQQPAAQPDDLEDDPEDEPPTKGSKRKVAKEPPPKPKRKPVPLTPAHRTNAELHRKAIARSIREMKKLPSVYGPILELLVPVKARLRNLTNAETSTAEAEKLRNETNALKAKDKAAWKELIAADSGEDMETDDESEEASKPTASKQVAPKKTAPQTEKQSGAKQSKTKDEPKTTKKTASGAASAPALTFERQTRSGTKLSGETGTQQKSGSPQSETRSRSMTPEQAPPPKKTASFSYSSKKRKASNADAATDKRSPKRRASS